MLAELSVAREKEKKKEKKISKYFTQAALYLENDHPHNLFFLLLS